MSKEKEKEYAEHFELLIKTVNAEKVAKLTLAMSDALMKIGFPFTPLELQLACAELTSAHLFSAKRTPKYAG